MDPQATLTRLHDLLVSVHLDGKPEFEPALFQTALDLHLWLDRGGFEPDWTRRPYAAGWFIVWRHGYRMRTLHKGSRVETPKGPGSVCYIREGASGDVVAVSVLLDAQRNAIGYVGTLFPAMQVQPAGWKPYGPAAGLEPARWTEPGHSQPGISGGSE